MPALWLPIASTVIASVSCVLGSSLILLKWDSEPLLCASMALSSGILLAAIFVDLLPTAMELLDNSKWITASPKLLTPLLFLLGIILIQSLNALIMYLNPSFSGCACHEPGKHASSDIGIDAEVGAANSVVACPDDCGICIDDRHPEHMLKSKVPPETVLIDTVGSVSQHPNEHTPLLPTSIDLENGDLPPLLTSKRNTPCCNSHHHHGHDHHDHDHEYEHADTRSFQALAIQTAVAIIIHKLPEGLITFTSSTHSSSMGLLLTLAIALHNFPEGVAIALPIYMTTKSRSQSFLIAAGLGGLTQPVGAAIGYALVGWTNIDKEALLGCVFAAASGILSVLVARGMLPMSYRIDTDGKRVWKYLLVGIFLGVVGWVVGV